MAGAKTVPVKTHTRSKPSPKKKKKTGFKTYKGIIKKAKKR
jgi:hypothetical protein